MISLVFPAQFEKHNGFNKDQRQRYGNLDKHTRRKHCNNRLRSKDHTEAQQQQQYQLCCAPDSTRGARSRTVILVEQSQWLYHRVTICNQEKQASKDVLEHRIDDIWLLYRSWRGTCCDIRAATRSARAFLVSVSSSCVPWLLANSINRFTRYLGWTLTGLQYYDILLHTLYY